LLLIFPSLSDAAAAAFIWEGEISLSFIWEISRAKVIKIESRRQRMDGVSDENF
jgi:hypothetical protein